MRQDRIQVEGLFRSPASWSRVLRGISVALKELNGVKLALQPHRGFQWDREFPLPEQLEDCPRRWDTPDCVVAFPYPPRLDRYAKRREPVWAMSVYEATRLPPAWVEPLRRVPSQILVPSLHTRELYRRSGIPVSKIRIIPYGYSPELFPDPATTERRNTGVLQLLTVATPHHRKGLDLIRELSDFLDRFTVEWHVHLPYRPEPGESRFWEDSDTPKNLVKQGFVVTVGRRSDHQIASMLVGADLVVQSSRSEGFGLAILEAMAAATPVVVPDWGGHMDFKGEGMITVEGTLRPAGRCQYDGRAVGARVFEPSLEHLRSQIQELLENPKSLHELGVAARNSVRNWTWEESARQLLRALRRFEPT